MLVLMKLVNSLDDHQGLLFLKSGMMLALLSSVGNVSVFINSFNRNYLGSAS